MPVYTTEDMLVEVAAKHPSIVAELRRRIIKGEFTPGEQFPTHDKLEKTFNASRVTVQKALDRLASDGFVFTRGRRGTYVAEYPPHLYHYGLIFPHRELEAGRWVRFWTALANESAKPRSHPMQRISCFYGIDGSDHEDSEKLMAAIRSHGLAGLLFTFPPPQKLQELLLKDFPSMPMTAILQGARLPYSVIELDSHAFIDKALDYLKSRGRRRIALITVPGLPADYMSYLTSALEARRLSTRPYWHQFIVPTVPVCARNCAHLLFNSDQKNRPDGLIITDDNLVEYATSGLIEAGIRMPGDLDIVAHCNFPWLTPSVIPARRLGYDANQVLRAGLDCIDRFRKGDTKPRVARVFPAFEDEVEKG